MTLFRYKPNSILTNTIKGAILDMRLVRDGRQTMDRGMYERGYNAFCKFMRNNLMSNSDAKKGWNYGKYDFVFYHDFWQASGGVEYGADSLEKVTGEMHSFYCNLKNFKKLDSESFDGLVGLMEKLAGRCNKSYYGSNIHRMIA